ncbi:MAG: hypothetical protein RLY84_724, partial [Actinomycetota bacterium]
EFVARFLGILELYRIGAIGVQQPTPFGEITLSWEAEAFDFHQIDGLGGEYDQ